MNSNLKKHFKAVKPLRIILPFVAFFIAFPACNDDDDNNVPAVQTAAWSFEVTFNITDPDVYTYDGTGIAEAEYTETSYTITANYSTGDPDFTDVVIDGAISDGVWDFTNKTLQIEFQNGEIQFTEIIEFSITTLTKDGGTATGTGDITIENVDAGSIESGTFDFTANMMLEE